MNKQHIDYYNQLSAWINEKEAYLKKKEEVNSVAEARTQLSLLDTFDKDKLPHEVSISQWKKGGEDILNSKYETSYSSYVFPTPEEVKQR